MSGSLENSTGSPLGSRIGVQTTLLAKGITMLNRVDGHSERSGADGLCEMSKKHCQTALFAVNLRGISENRLFY